MSPSSSAILGSLVADSATLGLHWLYDPVRIAEIEGVRGLVFLSPEPSDYQETKGYFAHSGKSGGDSSGYGETCLLMLKHLSKHGTFNRIGYQTEYRSYFGPGGSYVGYVDSPTRITLNTLLPLDPAEFPAESGADDDQFAALAALPPLVSTHKGTLDELMERVNELVRITNHNDRAVAAARCSSAVLFGVLRGTPIHQALSESLPFADNRLRALLEESLTYSSLDSIGVSERFGRACHVHEGLPVAFHIAHHAKDYRTAIEANIRAGGDSCGRSIMLGAIVAADRANQGGSDSPIPLDWLSRYRNLSVSTEALSSL
jgi:hypothetical protein